MSDLATKTCVPCRGGVPPLKGEDLSKLQKQVDGWNIIEEHHITKTFKFPDFRGALKFVNRVGELAEEQGHHPDIFLAWGKVETWHTPNVPCLIRPRASSIARKRRLSVWCKRIWSSASASALAWSITSPSSPPAAGTRAPASSWTEDNSHCFSSNSTLYRCRSLALGTGFSVMSWCSPFGSTG